MPKTKKTKMVVATTTTTKQSIFAAAAAAAAATNNPTTASQLTAAAAASDKNKAGGSTSTTTTTVTFAPPSNSNLNSNTPKSKSKRRQGRKGSHSTHTGNSTGSTSITSASFPFHQNTGTASTTATTNVANATSTGNDSSSDGKTVFGPPPPPPQSSNNNSTTTTTTTQSFTTPKGIPYSVITNLASAAAAASASASDSKNNNGGSSNNNNNNHHNGNGNNSTNSTTTSTNEKNSMSASMAAAAAAAFGNIDLVTTMTQSEMINFGVSTTTISSTSSSSSSNKKNKHLHHHHHHINNNNNTDSNSSNNNNTLSSSSSKNIKDVIQKYVDGSSSSTSKKGNGNNSQNNNNNKDSSSCSSSGGDVGPGITSQSCSDDDMKALMKMFVEIMGMSSNLDSNNNTNKENNNDHGNKKSSSSDSASDDSTNIDTAAMNAARASISEHFTRMHMQNAANFIGNSDNRSSSSHNGNNSKASKGKHTKSSGNSTSGSFPVVSMMFGSGSGGNVHGNNNNNSNNRNKNMPNVIPPPPGGWPPGAAAAAAAALAAASNGAASVTVPIGNGSISLPLSMAHVASSSNGGGNTSSDRSPPEWMREACRQFIINENHHFDDGSDVSAVHGSDDEDEDDIDDEIYSSHSHNTSSGSNNRQYVKPAPQDRSSGSELYGNKGKNDSSSNHNVTDADQETSDAAAAALLQEEEEKAKRAAKKREKKNRKKEKAKREAAIKAARTAQKKREKNITSWRSRVATACSSGEVHKVDALISDNPFKDGKQQQLDPDIREELGGGDVLSYEEEVTQNMEWLLPSCVAKFRETKPREVESRAKLGIFVMRMAFHVVFVPLRDGRSALHTACVVGDVSFVKLVAERIVDGEEEETNRLDLRCHNMGWSPLHYAAAYGWYDVVEILLSKGCEVGIRTDPSLTCYISNEKGVTPKELLEFIHDENYSNSLDYNKDGMDEIVRDKLSGNAKACEAYKNTLVDLITRLNDVEINGYRPSEMKKVDIVDQKQERISHGANIISKATSKTSKKKKKKKKKAQAQANNDDAAEESSVAASIASTSIASAPLRPEPEVDLVSMLLAMGFTEEQIHAAADACGGTDRATADDLVEWILSGGQSDNNLHDNEASTPTDGMNALNTSSSRASNFEQKQKRAAMQAKKEAEEAAKREAEAKAAAERLAAKREEQRRIRREWNNREQQRQQEEAKAKLAEEVERKRRLEIEKAKVTAQRVAKERAVNAAMMYQDPNNVTSIHGPLPTATNSNVGATPLFPGTVFQASSAHVLNTENQYYPDMHSPNLTFGQSMMQQNTRLFPQGATKYRSNSNTPHVAAKPEGHNSGSKSKKSSPINLEQNGYEFPSLVGSKPSSPNRRQRQKSKDSPTSDDSRKGSRSRGQRRSKNDSPVKEKRLEQNFTPTKIVVAKSFEGQKGPIPGAAMTNAASYQSNPLGEIRATAKAFVPTHFTPSARSSPQPPGLVNPSTMPPPGLVPPTAAPNHLLPPQSSTSGTLPPAPKQNSSVLPSGASLLPSNAIGYDVNNVTLSPSIKEPFSSSSTELLGGNTNHCMARMSSPPTNTTSSMVGLTPKPEENIPIPFGASPLKTNNELLGSKVLGNLPDTLPPSTIGSSLGILEPNPSGPSLAGPSLSGPSLSGPPLSGASIWGGGSSAAPAAGNLGFSFNFGNNTGRVDSSNDNQNDESDSSNLWGTGGAMNGNMGGGSIW